MLTKTGCHTLLLVFHRKDPCEARPKVQSVFKFSDVLYALSQTYPPVVKVSGQVDIFVRSSCQIDLWSDRPPNRDISWPSLELLHVRLTFGQTYPPVEESSDQEWYYFRSGWLLVRCTPTNPLVETSCGQEWYYFRSGWPLVRHIPW